MNNNKRIEKDILGEMEIPSDVYWGINTQRALENFQISGKTLPSSFIIALAQVKKACLLTNIELELIEDELGKSILQAVDEIIEGKHLDQFPIDIFQTGSGTQTNMNMNEVIANRANELLGHPRGQKHPVHPIDHVNKGQSSNDVIPTAMYLSALALLQNFLLPSIQDLINILENKILEFKDVIKVGRTHLQDAVPIPLSLEFEVYKKQFINSVNRLVDACIELSTLPLGGTAIGTGINTHKDFSGIAIKHLSEISRFSLKENPIKAEGIASHNALVKVSGVLRTIALALMKMANDIRWMGSGPRAGLGELLIPQNEAGSSIMPGKINPTQSEMLIQVCLQVIGNDSTISMAESHGSILDLNVTKPIIIVNMLESIYILFKGINSFSTKCLLNLKANTERINELVEKNLMIVTKLAPIIGYDLAADIAMEAHTTGKSLKEIIKKKKLKFDEDIDELLDPMK
ncbi:MAG: class II fumarate hydratase [Candidatus Heimdallarchaeaceae archaeon]|jgi:fumarate hydratase class II